MSCWVLERPSAWGGQARGRCRRALSVVLKVLARFSTLGSAYVDCTQISTHHRNQVADFDRMAQRVTIRKRTPYNTTSNRRRVVKTPGGKLVVHHIKKLAVSRTQGVVCQSPSSNMNSLPPSAVTAVRLLPVSPLSAPASTPLSPSVRRPSTAPTVDPSVPLASRAASPALSSSRRLPSSSASSRPRPPPLRSRLRYSASDGRWIWHRAMY